MLAFFDNLALGDSIRFRNTGYNCLEVVVRLEDGTEKTVTLPNDHLTEQSLTEYINMMIAEANEPAKNSTQTPTPQ